MAASISSSSSRLLFLRPPPQPSPTSIFSFFLKPLLISTTTTSTSLSKATFHKIKTPFTNSLPHLRSLTPPFSHSLSTLTDPPTDISEEEEEEEEEEEGEIENGGTDGEDTQMGVDSSSLSLNSDSEVKLPVPSLTVKEKKELASYAHSLGKKLTSQLVGKSGVTATVASAFVENLEKNELLKIKIHRTCPGELDDVVKQLEESTGSVVVGQIGRTVIIYKPSLTKLKAEEKKMQARKVFVRKDFKLKPVLPNKEQAFRPSGRGRRGNSRFKVEN